MRVGSGLPAGEIDFFGIKACGWGMLAWSLRARRAATYDPCALF